MGAEDSDEVAKMKAKVEMPLMVVPKILEGGPGK